MKIFVDTSALVKLYYPETDSDTVEEKLLDADSIYLSDLAIVEFASALMKKERSKELTKKELLLIWGLFESDLQSTNIDIIELTAVDYRKAAELIIKKGANYNIRTLDALQLSAALSIKNIYLLATDNALNEVATKIGLRLT